METEDTDKSVMDDVDSNSGSDDDWEGIEEEVELSVQTKCIFCSEIFNNAELMFDHCRSQHMFDVVSYSRRMNLNCIGYIKFINYMRMHRPSSSEILEIMKGQCPWNKDDYMKPYDASDSLLTFDIESYVQEKMKERDDVDEMISIPQSRFEAILQKLAHKEMKLQNAYDRIDKMKEAAKTVLLCNNQACNNQGTSGEVRPVINEPGCDEDGYFSTYDHFAIHHEMLQDKVRTVAYQEAILKNPQIFKDKRVLDVGCGTSILSMFAAKAGAASVLGVDKSDVIFQAMDIVRENGFEKQIDLFKGRIEDVPNTESKVDVIVSEWMGYFLLFEGMLDSVLYARDKFLKPGGYMFPDRCTISILAVSDTDKYKEYIEFWDDVYGFKMSTMKKDVIKEANVEVIKPEVICCEPVVVKIIHRKVNTDAVNGIVNIGCGYTNLNSLLTVLDVPPISQTLYDKEQKVISEAWKKLAYTEMENAAMLEKKLAIQCRDMDKCETPLVTVIVDGSWDKRSYRTNSSSLSGAELDITQCKPENSEFCSTFELKMTRDCSVTALVGYFDCYFEKGLEHKVTLSTSPTSTLTHWKQTLFLLPTPVQVIEGEIVSCKISCRKNRRDPRSLIVKLNFGKSFNQYFLS